MLARYVLMMANNLFCLTVALYQQWDVAVYPYDYRIVWPQMFWHSFGGILHSWHVSLVKTAYCLKAFFSLALTALNGWSAVWQFLSPYSLLSFAYPDFCITRNLEIKYLCCFVFFLKETPPRQALLPPSPNQLPMCFLWSIFLRLSLLTVGGLSLPLLVRAEKQYMCFYGCRHVNNRGQGPFSSWFVQTLLLWWHLSHMSRSLCNSCSKAGFCTLLISSTF